MGRPLESAMLFSKRREPFGGLIERDRAKMSRDESCATASGGRSSFAEPQPSMHPSGSQVNVSMTLESTSSQNVCLPDGMLLDIMSESSQDTTSYLAVMRPPSSSREENSMSIDRPPCFACHLRSSETPCSHCVRRVCELCCRQCDGCQEVFCTFCSTPNYDERHDRTFCLDCNLEEANRRTRSAMRSRAPQGIQAAGGSMLGPAPMVD